MVLGGEGGSLVNGPREVGRFVWVVLGGRGRSCEWSQGGSGGLGVVIGGGRGAMSGPGGGGDSYGGYQGGGGVS